MMDLLENLKKKVEDSGLICEIQSEAEEVLPEVALIPLGEYWEHDNLGNRRAKEIEFYVARYIDKHNYAKDVRVGTDYIEEFYAMLKEEEILHIDRCSISVAEITDLLLVEVKANIKITIYKRGR